MNPIALRLLKANKPKVIAVFAATRADAARAVKHLQTSDASLPIWVWCGDNSEEPPADGIDRFVPGASYYPRGLQDVWPALSIVAWTGAKGALPLKLLPFLAPPFRVVVLNEAGDFFPPRPARIAEHLWRRVRDAAVAKTQLAGEWSAGAFQWGGSQLRRVARKLFWICLLTVMGTWHTAQKIYWRFFHATLALIRLMRTVFSWVASFFYRAGERVRDVFVLAFESIFALIALCATPLAPIARAAVQRTAAGPRAPLTLDVEDTGPNRESVTEVILPNRGWSRREVLCAATRSDAEFLLLRKKGETAAADPLVALARETGAFAVARQMAWSSWREKAVVKHPFRRLQPGETSEVFAPFSSLILVRRHALLRLGVPRAFTAGAALMSLFWKASAAGLRNLVLGHADLVTDEPAMALEDVEFATRLLLSPRLNRLGPQRPARYRGNLAWSPSDNRQMRDKPRVLVVSPYLPFPLSHGGAVRIYNLCRVLSDRVDFILATFHESGEKICYDELNKVFREIYVVDIDEKHADETVPRQVAEYRNAAMEDLIRSLCLSGEIDLVQLEYTQMAEYRKFAGSLPVILVEHDITFSLYDQLAGFERKPEIVRQLELWRDFEREALQCSDTVWTMSEEERALAIEYRAPRNRTLAIPNGVDVRRYESEPKPEGPPTVLFVGSFRHLPNLLAYESLRTLIMPEVWRECPEAILHVIAGPLHEQAAERQHKASLLAAHPNIHIEGFVSDVRPAYRSADVVAVPLPLSAGTNIKIIEAMACGRAIVSTASGCRGLNLTNGVELIETALDSSFATAIVAVLRDDDLRTRLAANARRAAEQRFSWDSIAEDAFASYGELAHGERSARVAAAVTSLSPAS